MPVLRQKLSICIAYCWMPFAGETRPCSHESSNFHDPFAVNVRTCLRPLPCTAQHAATPIKILNFREEKFRDQKANHETHENIAPQKFGATPYACIHASGPCALCSSAQLAPICVGKGH